MRNFGQQIMCCTKVSSSIFVKSGRVKLKEKMQVLPAKI